MRASLMGRSYFWQDPPLFFRGQKRKFYNGANGQFLLCHANSQKPPMLSQVSIRPTQFTWKLAIKMEMVVVCKG